MKTYIGKVSQYAVAFVVSALSLLPVHSRAATYANGWTTNAPGATINAATSTITNIGGAAINGNAVVTGNVTGAVVTASSWLVSGNSRLRNVGTRLLLDGSANNLYTGGDLAAGGTPIAGYELTANGDFIVTQTASIPTNTAPFTMDYSLLVLDQWYTNAAQRGFLIVNLDMDTGASGVSSVTLYVDEDRNGTWEFTNTLTESGVANLDHVDSLMGSIQPSARLVISNESTGSGTAIVISTQFARQ